MTNRLKFGDANPADPTQTPAVLDPNHFSGIDNLKKSALETTQPKLLKKIIGPIKGVVLKRKETPVGTEANKPPDNSWLSSLFGDSAVPNLPIYYVRIPEFHSHLPEPEDYANCDASIAILYPEFIAMKEGPDMIANPGDLVWVDFIDRENFSEPIFIGKIVNPPNMTPQAIQGTNGVGVNSQGSLNMNAPGGWSNGSFESQIPEYEPSMAASYVKNALPTIYSKDLVEKAMRKKGYTWYADSDFKMNIVGVRNSSTGKNVTNTFDDMLTLSFKENGVWQYYEFPITTDPGKSSTLDFSNRNGVGRLVPGQYLNSHIIRSHPRSPEYPKTGYPALGQQNPVTVFRDANRNLTYDEGVKETGVFGINIHRSGVDSQSVDRWSEGCQVFKKQKDFDFFMILCAKSSKLNTNSFTYTLLESTDII